MSTQALACPSCGAPIEPTEAQLDQGRTACPGCRAALVIHRAQVGKQVFRSSDHVELEEAVVAAPDGVDERAGVHDLALVIRTARQPLSAGAVVAGWLGLGMSTGLGLAAVVLVAQGLWGIAVLPLLAGALVLAKSLGHRRRVHAPVWLGAEIVVDRGGVRSTSLLSGRERSVATHDVMGVDVEALPTRRASLVLRRKRELPLVLCEDLDPDTAYWVARRIRAALRRRRPT